MSIYNPSGSIAVGAASGVVSLASGSFLENNGGIVGVLLSLIYIGITIFIIYITIPTKEGDQLFKNRIYIYIGSIIVILGTIINNYYFITSQSKKEQANSTYSNVALIPIYLSVLGIVLGIVLSVK